MHCDEDEANKCAALKEQPEWGRGTPFKETARQTVDTNLVAVGIRIFPHDM